jgi:adenylate kinase
VILIDVPEAKLIDRLTGRRTCALCKRVFHVTFNPPPTAPPYCTDHADCPSEVYQREDDTLEVVVRRQEAYRRQTEPLVAYYTERGLLQTVDGDRPPAEITAELKALMG